MTSVSTNQRPSCRSSVQVGSVGATPQRPVLGFWTGGSPKNEFCEIVGEAGVPSALNTRTALLTISKTYPLPVHSPWSGGVVLNPAATVWVKSLMPSQLRRKPGLAELTVVGVTTGGAKPATACAEVADRCRDRLRPTAWIAFACAAAAPAVAEADDSLLNVTLCIRTQCSAVTPEAPVAAT